MNDFPATFIQAYAVFIFASAAVALAASLAASTRWLLANLLDQRRQRRGWGVAEHIIYDGPAGNGRLVVVVRPGRVLADRPAWLVQFTRCGAGPSSSTHFKWLLTAAWLPERDHWDCSRYWMPTGSRLVPPAILATVEAWLRGRPVGEAESITTTMEAS